MSSIHSSRLTVGTGAQARDIAIEQRAGGTPGLFWLNGFRSVMSGLKAMSLDALGAEKGYEVTRFDYSGHGVSGEKFVDGCIGDWAEDACAVIEAAVEGPVVLVGSSMGGWISCLVTKAMPDRIAGFVGIAAAPDFTEDGFWASFNDATRDKLMTEGQVSLPSDYVDSYIITKRLIEDGRDQLVLRDPLPMAWPVRLLQGTEDASVSRETALRLLDHIDGADARLTLVKGADHRFSEPECLKMIEEAVLDIV